MNNTCGVPFKIEEHEAYRQIHWRLEDDRTMRIAMGLNGKRLLFSMLRRWWLAPLNLFVTLGLAKKQRKATQLLN